MRGEAKIALVTVAVWLWLGVPAAWARPANTAPKRIVSVNLCSDIYTLAFADRNQIASLSYVASNSPLSPVKRQAQGIPVNEARIEEVLMLQPDLVLTYEYADPRLARWLRGQGLRVETLSAPQSLVQVASEWRRVAALLGHPQRGAALAKHMAALLASAPRNAGSAAVYGPGGIGAAAGSLLPDLLKATGYRLLRGLSQVATGRVDLETLLLRQPDVLIRVRDVAQANTLAARATHHPVLAQLNARIIDLPSRLWMCGGPELLDAIRRLEAGKEPLIESR